MFLSQKPPKKQLSANFDPKSTNPLHAFGHNFWTGEPILKNLDFLKTRDQGLSSDIKKKDIYFLTLDPPPPPTP